MSCLKTGAIYGSCSVPPAHVTGDPAHIVGVALFCGDHCPVCHPVVQFLDEIPPISGEQEDLLF